MKNTKKTVAKSRLNKATHCDKTAGSEGDNPLNPKRLEYLKLRVTKEEHTKLVELGKNAGGFSNLVRNTFLGHPNFSEYQARAQLFRLLASINGNLNAIARRFTGFASPAKAVEVIALLHSLERSVEKLAKETGTK